MPVVYIEVSGDAATPTRSSVSAPENLLVVERTRLSSLRFAIPVIGVTAASFLAVRSYLRGTSELFPTGSVASLAYLGVGAAILGSFWASGRAKRRLARVALLAGSGTLATALGLVGIGRARSAWIEVHQTSHRAHGLAELSQVERVRWAVQVAAHRISGEDFAAPRSITVPADWPFPNDVKVSVSMDPTGRSFVWGRSANGNVWCLTRRIYAAGDVQPQTDALRCARHRPASAPPDSTFSPVTRAPLPMQPVPPPSHGETWPQYRRDGARSGTLGLPANRTAWHAQVFGELRASVSGTDSVIVIGAHGTGSIEVFDAESGIRRWRRRAPNWIHEDAVTDGATLVVGFGDNYRSFLSRSPAGVTAYDLRTGALRWTAFEQTSVMSSPAIVGDVVVYGNQDGLVRKRRLSDGALLGETSLPGAIDMAPPVVQGDTLVASLEPNSVCAVLISSLQRIWCQTFPGLRGFGHASPSLADGRVIVAGVAPMYPTDWAFELGRLGAMAEAQMLFRAAIGRRPADRGQQVIALRLADGATLWKTPMFAPHRAVTGHLSGTAAIAGNVGTIILPVSDAIVAFDVRNGGVLWTADAGGSRGPPLIASGRVIISGHAGSIRALDLASGVQRCSTVVPAHYDRASASAIDGFIVFSSLDGGLDAVPADWVARCRQDFDRVFALGRAKPLQGY